MASSYNCFREVYLGTGGRANVQQKSTARKLGHGSLIGYSVVEFHMILQIFVCFATDCYDFCCVPLIGLRRR